MAATKRGTGGGETRAGVPLTNLDAALFDGAGATKRDLVDYLDAAADRLVPVLAGRALSVVRVHRGEAPFMQKNLPKHAPDWIPAVEVWAGTAKRTVSYPVCNDRRTLVWFANQRAVEYHPALVLGDRPNSPTHLVLDLDPPIEGGFPLAVQAALLVRHVLDDLGLAGAVKTSGAKGVHVFVPLDSSVTDDEAAAATRAIAARAVAADPALATGAFVKDERAGKVFVDPTRVYGATVVAAWSPRIRPGVPVSFPVGWDALTAVSPADFTLHTALRHAAESDPWAEAMPAPQRLPAELVAEGREIPAPRVQALHEGRRRARTRSSGTDGPGATSS